MFKNSFCTVINDLFVYYLDVYKKILFGRLTQVSFEGQTILVSLLCILFFANKMTYWSVNLL